ncbi:MAG TPA: hypothetical protein ENK56_09920 [Chloroflexi bacterium]|nr:hypothetical protein [Chloroflexota bacterium]
MRVHDLLRGIGGVLAAMALVLAAGLLWSTGVLAGPVEAPPAQVVPKQHPPFFLRTETGEVINPLTGENADQPYSPRQTCGAEGCHDYATITLGYHFQQGADVINDHFDPERPWVLSDGMFGKH